MGGSNAEVLNVASPLSCTIRAPLLRVLLQGLWALHQHVYAARGPTSVVLRELAVLDICCGACLCTSTWCIVRPEVHGCSTTVIRKTAVAETA